MAIPKRLTSITRDKAESIVKKHPEGHWEGAPWNSDFIYEGRMTKNGYHRYEMVRAYSTPSYSNYEHGVVSL